MNRRRFFFVAAAGAVKAVAQSALFRPDYKTTDLWLDALELTELSDGAPVRLWRDKSPNGYDAIVPSGLETSFNCYGGAKPGYQAPTLARRAINNLPALNFNSDHTQPTCGRPAGPKTPGNNQTLILRDRGRDLDKNAAGFTAIIVPKTMTRKLPAPGGDYILITHTASGNTRFALSRSSSGTTDFHVRPADGDADSHSPAHGDSGFSDMSVNRQIHRSWHRILAGRAIA